MVESQRYVQETELSQRVRCWEERMVPLLQEQAGIWEGLGPLFPTSPFLSPLS